MAVRNLSRDEVRQKLDGGRAAVVEALPEQYYREAHLPGALLLPVDDVDELAPGLLPDKDAEVIVYCTGTTCSNSGIAARRLAELGYSKVFTYEGGKEDWVGGGLPTESGV
ncbi:rhodanese-like domain-containing protein [Streptomyces sp. NBC_01244]|uniref:rhodanese-like domain-containing protein n=1 Tax=Streptomyces sp. NBC_01244 TaxID=2903797 RepID=UPI002E0E39CE|nr:rhodanese-like domain-containing protein [Streptomyces sp. NBC_01244]